MTALWRINISPAARDGADPRAFCFGRGIVGFGWPVEANTANLSWTQYEELATELYYNADDHGWWPAANALYNRMRIGDLVWSRDWYGVYYIGRVCGEWQYSDDIEHQRVDIFNFRACEWYRVGLADRVPGAVRNSFSRGRVLQVVNAPSALIYSAKVFDRLAGRNEYRDLAFDGKHDLFELISSSALEDLVGLYLQSIGYSIVPSTCHRTSAAYEFVLRHRESGEPATLQVKSGGQTLNRDDYQSLPGTVFLFAVCEVYTGQEHSSIRTISRAVLEDFAKENQETLPETISVWL